LFVEIGVPVEGEAVEGGVGGVKVVGIGEQGGDAVWVGEQDFFGEGWAKEGDEFGVVVEGAEEGAGVEEEEVEQSREVDVGLDGDEAFVKAGPDLAGADEHAGGDQGGFLVGGLLDFLGGHALGSV
jgi:hypothetical protein